jgi:hypothetical protein
MYSNTDLAVYNLQGYIRITWQLVTRQNKRGEGSLCTNMASTVRHTFMVSTLSRKASEGKLGYHLGVVRLNLLPNS